MYLAINSMINTLSTIVGFILSLEIPWANNQTITMRSIIIGLFLIKCAFQLVYIFINKNHFWEKDHKSKGGSYGKD